MIRTFEVELKGVSPLPMHADNIEWADYMEAWKNDPANQKSSKAGDDRSPAFRWIGSAYTDGTAWHGAARPGLAGRGKGPMATQKNTARWQQPPTNLGVDTNTQAC